MQGLRHTVIASWYWREGYLTAIADLIETELDKFASPEEVQLFFSAHGVPKSYVEEFGDPYKEEIEQCVGMVMERLHQRKRENKHILAYQSRVGPVSHISLLRALQKHLKGCVCGPGPGPRPVKGLSGGQRSVETVEM